MGNIRMHLASFDIFDTALIRKCGKPEGIFALLGQKIYPDDAAERENFTIWRQHAGTRRQLLVKKKDVTLQDIYEDADFPPWTAEQLMQAEIAVEEENLVANPLIQTKIAQYRNAGWTICFISDMYLSSEILRKILIREGCADPNDEIFVSCELQARKDFGTLYKVVREKLYPQCWIHFGDNQRSDVKQARKNGVKAHLVSSRYTAIEENIMQHTHLFRRNFDLQLLAGLSRMARMKQNNTPEAVLAADYVAPGYLPYVFHIATYAQDKGIKKIFFLSRDGYILKQTLEATFHELETDELFVSRNSLLLPYLADDFSCEAYLKIQDRNTLISRKVTPMLWRMGLNREMLDKQYNITFSYERICTQENEQDYLKKIFDSPLTLELKKEAVHQRDLLIRYFQQIKLAGNEPALLVDIGWLGTSRVMINSILTHAGYSPMEFIYLGVRKDVLPLKYGKFTTFFPESELSTRNTVLIENYFSQSPNPSVRRYQEQNGLVLPEWEKEPDRKESMSLTVNRSILQMMGSILKTWNLSPETLYAWAKLSFNAIDRLDVDINLTPLLFAGDFENMIFVKKLSCREIILYLLGKQITAFDDASVLLTLGRIAGRKAIAVHTQASRSFYHIYKGIMHYTRLQA